MATPFFIPRGPVPVQRRTNVGGSFRHAKRFQTGGAVPTFYARGGVAVPTDSAQARARRVREFEMQHANHSI